MANYFLLELDTTPPIIEIYAPSYVTRESNAEVVIQSDGCLSLYQDIYVIDSVGTRRDYTFNYNETLQQYIGVLNFKDYPLGEITIYAQLQDDVWNMSEKVYQTIVIKESLTRMSLDMADQLKGIVVAGQKAHEMIVTDSARHINIKTELERATVQSNTRAINIETMLKKDGE